MNNKINVAIFGGSGYGGSELLRLLLFHPNVEIVLVTANEHAGKPVSDIHKNLNGLTELIFQPAPENIRSLIDLDIAFFALPHGQALKLIPDLPEPTKAVDLSGDFRINDPNVFERFYKHVHSGAIQKQFVYGLTETNRTAIRSARFVANPGCFATATLLALAPLVGSKLVGGRIIVDAKTGSSGSGIKPATNTHHPQRTNSFYVYKPFIHQHLPEIEQHLSSLGDYQDGMVFMTHSMPVSRGIFASCYLESNVGLTNEDLHNLYRKFYEDSYFVRLVDGSPDINWVKTTNFCDISIHTDGKNIAIFSAIDNLVKGAAGQAVQNMNLMFGLDETTGLRIVGTNP
ncbi:N-acetyl-gamma-glutamyl-phosphate reductase [Leptolyngbya sp. 7M]|uniref:N-acetyl-gamma-glutamyl-phosphate reductase n=1 Tax=Leptolyngbya sp. 7M TaxID=2812896 RepID=UPI001B8AD66A|nr:N-acetyl-gamma-glutamyl-phosphate reductase [Leptolyngbya sp. 7M]QYO65578.1 N-acetyl-gamma-glutamyl-phosphate reductase [Leptolyngbya sp. 7M]